jgi:kumamolisin
MYQYAKQWSVGIAAALILSCITPAFSQDATHTPFKAQPEVVFHAAPATAVARPGTVIVPPSAVARPEDAGRFAHTNIKLFIPAGKTLGTINPETTFAEYPSSIGCVYGQSTHYTGCQPVNNGLVPAGGWGAIAVVDAYDYGSTALNDMNYFSTYFGIANMTTATFHVIYANTSYGTLNGLTPSCSGTPASAVTNGWDVEEALDMEWAHAMAPAAKIYLVEACSNSLNDLLYAVQVAGLKTDYNLGGDISMSWGTGEFASEVGAGGDDFFYRTHWSRTTYFASAGDSGLGAQWPSSSPWVVSAGGTTINRDASGNLLSESCWSGSGGGTSAFELWQSTPNIEDGMGPWANFQYPFAGQGARQTPDISFDADPNSGVYVYDTAGSVGWYIVGGTSVSSPALAGIVNASGQHLGQAPPAGGYYNANQNTYMYAQLFAHNAYANAQNWYDVKTGSNGASAVAGYDNCTGIGTPRGRGGK